MVSRISVEEFKELMESGSLVVDVRDPQEFTSGFVPGSIFLESNSIAAFAPAFIDKSKPLIIVGNQGEEKTIINLLQQAGIDTVKGFLNGGFQLWRGAHEPVDMVIDIEADELAMDFRFDKNMLLVDLRPFNEYKEGHVQDSINIPVEELADVAQVASLDEEGFIYLYSEQSSLSCTAASILKKHGIHHIHIVNGGWNKISQMNDIPVKKLDVKPENNKKAI